VQSLRDRESDGNTATRQRENDGVAADLVEKKLAGQQAARFETICKWKINRRSSFGFAVCLL
jgi:hypothetical protein